MTDKTLEMFTAASRVIQLYTYNLDPRILNNRSLERVLVQFIKKNRASKLQVLIYDEQLMQGQDHRVVALAQRFSSYVQVRVVPKDFHENLFSFYLIDNQSILYRSNRERYESDYHQMPSFLVKDKTKLFNDVWQISTPASFLRSLYI